MKLTVILTSLMLAASSFGAVSTSWKKIKTRKKVEVFKGEIPGSPIVAFKGTGYIDANIVKVVSVIRDEAQKPKWISDLAETRVLKQVSLLEKVEYNRTKTPWPLDDRDFVYRAKVVINKEKKELEIKINHETHPDAPARKGVVRGELSSSRYFLKSIDGGKRTYVEVEIFADPKGKVPKWLVNLFQSVWPSNTLDGIRKIAEDPSYKIQPAVASYAEKLNQ